MKIKVSLDRDTKAFLTKLGRFDVTLRTALIRKADEVGWYIVGETKAEIEGQNFHPLQAKYIRWKLKHGYSGDILKMMPLMMHQISYKRMITSAALIRGDIGFRIGTMHPHWGHKTTKVTQYKRKKDNKLITRKTTKPTMFPTAVLAESLEFGTSRGVKARPFFFQTYLRVRKSVGGMFGSAVQAAWMGI